MKRSELIAIIFIVSVSVIISFFVTRALFGGAANDSVTIKTAEPINATIVQPDPAIFNSSAINPTYEVTIGGSGSDVDSGLSPEGE